MKIEIKEILQEAAECLEDAKALMEKKRYKAVVSRSYYAMYHTAKAVLQNINVETFTHQGVNTQFAKHFIKTGIFDKIVFKTFSKMLDKRLKADYEVGFKADEDEAKYAFSEATDFYTTIIEYLEQ